MYVWISLLRFATLFSVLCHVMNNLHSSGCYQFNFVGRLLGPRGNSLKRVEATTQCRVYIRGRGSVKDSVKVTKHTIMYCCPLPDFSKFASLKPLDAFWIC
jgi:hypothetical protein